jgi:hypothetical protein
MIGPFWGNVAVITIGGAITLACFAAMFWMIFRPGEHSLDHPKNSIFGDVW